MKILFFDIETVPTERSLQDNGLLESQIRLDEAEIIKKLSLAAATSRILCLAYALEPPLDSPVEVIHGDETEIIQSFWKLATEMHLFVGHIYWTLIFGLFTSVPSSTNSKPSREIPLPGFATHPFSTRCTSGVNGGASTSVSMFYPAPWGFRRPKRVWTVPKFIPITALGGFPRSVSTVNGMWKRCGRSIGG
jgi:hypothetical protein